LISDGQEKSLGFMKFPDENIDRAWSFTIGYEEDSRANFILNLDNDFGFDSLGNTSVVYIFLQACNFSRCFC